MRLIDADALLKHAGIFEVKARARGCGNSILNLAKAWLWNEVNIAPTIDAVPVVRCRECKHLNVVNRKELYAHCPKTNTVFLPFELDTREHFCSLGERKEGANNDT